MFKGCSITGNPGAKLIADIMYPNLLPVRRSDTKFNPQWS